ncbi:MAG: hypothetical protein AAF998_21710 [Bacteroidota bacterium]
MITKATTLLVGLSSLLGLWLPAQTLLPVKQAPLPEATERLLLPDSVLRGQPRTTESVLDLVVPWMLDDRVTRRRQRHVGPLGWMAQRFWGRYWQILDSTKRKYVGTISRPFKIYEGFADEYDLNIFLMPHLPRYVDMAWNGFQVALRRPRSEKHFRFDRPDYECPAELAYQDRGYLTIECEGTPYAPLRDRLAEVFLPMASGPHDLEQWPITGTKNASFGLYGTWCMDCNHNCRPEIHPFEWLWWLDLSADRPGGPRAKSWMIGVLRDGSRRFEDWSPGPRTGTLAIPVAIPKDAPAVRIELEHLAFDSLAPLPEAALAVPADAFSATGNHEFTLVERQIPIQVSFSGSNPQNQIKVWWSDLQHDPRTGTTMGYLNLALSVNNVYAGRLTVDFAPLN